MSPSERRKYFKANKSKYKISKRSLKGGKCRIKHKAVNSVDLDSDFNLRLLELLAIMSMEFRLCDKALRRKIRILLFLYLVLAVCVGISFIL